MITGLCSSWRKLDLLTVQTKVDELLALHETHIKMYESSILRGPSRTAVVKREAILATTPCINHTCSGTRKADNILKRVSAIAKDSR